MNPTHCRVDVAEVRKTLYQLDMMRHRPNVSQEAYERWERAFEEACSGVVERRPRLVEALDRLVEVATS